MVLGPLRDHHLLFLPEATTFFFFMCPSLCWSPSGSSTPSSPFFFSPTPLSPLKGLYFSTVVRFPAPVQVQFVLPLVFWAQKEKHLGFGPAGLGLGGWPVLPPLGSLNTFQMDTLMQNGQFLNIYYTERKLYLLYLLLGCFLHWKLFEHCQLPLACLGVFLFPMEFSSFLPVGLLLIP